MTRGEACRVEELAKNPRGFKPKDAKPYHLLAPLHELIAFHLSSLLASKKTWEIYNSLINHFENEFNILLNVSKEELLEKKFDEKLIEFILLNRRGKIQIDPGFDGEYGKITLKEKQGTLL